MISIPRDGSMTPRDLLGNLDMLRVEAPWPPIAIKSS
jgi:hypothetical protein